jgi:hypothetical protein
MGRSAPEQKPGRLYLSAVFERAKEIKLSPSKRLLLCALFRYLGDRDFCFPSQKALAEDTGLSERTVRTLLKELEGQDNVIEISMRQTTGRKHGNHAYEYRLTFPQKESQTGNLKQNQTGNLRQPNRKSTATKAEIHDSQTGNSRHSKQPEKQASRERAGSEYVKNKSKNKSVNQSGTDRLTDEKTSLSSKRKPAAKKKGDALVEGKGFALAEVTGECFAPPPGAPPRLTPKQIEALFGGPGPRPVNLLDCPEEEFNLSALVAPFKGQEVIKTLGFNPDLPQSPWFEKSLKEFSKQVFDRHWSKKASPPRTPFHRLFCQAGRSGLLYEFGFRPLHPKELERQKEKAAKAARIREEEERREAKKEAKFKIFIRKPTVRSYFDFLGFPPRDYQSMRDHIREIASRFNGRATINAVENFMRETLQNEGYR